MRWLRNWLGLPEPIQERQFTTLQLRDPPPRDTVPVFPGRDGVVVDDDEWVKWQELLEGERHG